MLNATIVERQEITPELIVIKVKPDGGVPEFRPGQYVALGLPGTSPRLNGLPADREDPGEKLIKRAYSIGSAPSQRDHLEFYVAIVPEGALTPRLAVPAVGERIFVAPKITGTFTLDPVPAEKHLVLVSTGTGVAPFLSMIRTPATWSDERLITIVHGVRYAKDLAYRDELLSHAESNPRLRYHAIVSREDPSWQGPTGRIQRLFEDGTITLDPARDHVFLCGNPAMIDDMETLLCGQGFSVHSKKNPTGALHLERYW